MLCLWWIHFKVLALVSGKEFVDNKGFLAVAEVSGGGFGYG